MKEGILCFCTCTQFFIHFELHRLFFMKLNGHFFLISFVLFFFILALNKKYLQWKKFLEYIDEFQWQNISPCDMFNTFLSYFNHPHDEYFSSSSVYLIEPPPSQLIDRSDNVRFKIIKFNWKLWHFLIYFMLSAKLLVSLSLSVYSSQSIHLCMFVQGVKM